MQQNPWDLPEPQGVERVSSFRPWKPVIVVGLIAGIVVASMFVPVPVFYAFMPGPVRDVHKLVHISDEETYPSDGRLLLTTVSVDLDVTVAEWFMYSLNPSRGELILQQELTGGQSLQQLREFERREMEASKRQAIEVAFTALGHGAPTGDGARVVDVLKETPAEGNLEEGDRIVEVDGRKVATACDVDAAIDAHEIGDEMTMVVSRDGARETVSVDLSENPQAPGTPFVGIAMTDINYEYDPAADVEIDTDEIGGPSAGLMLTLTLYDQLTPEDLTAGRAIAGTGTIECNGGVGAIGGIEQKVAGAENNGAEIFLAPAANAADAEAAADDLEVVTVDSFEDAVEYLEGLD